MPIELAEMGNIDASQSYFQRYHLPYDSRILDIGTYFGSFIQRLYKSGYGSVMGVDIGFKTLATGIETYPELRGRLVWYSGHILPFADESFDAVTMFDVLEHVAQPHIYMHEVRRVLKPHGLLIFQTPNLVTNIPWEIVQTRSLTYWRTYHCSLQTLGSLLRLLQQADFKDIVVEKYSLMSEYNTTRARKVLGGLGVQLMRLARYLPLGLFPNFWGSCRRPMDVRTSRNPESASLAPNLAD